MTPGALRGSPGGATMETMNDAQKIVLLVLIGAFVIMAGAFAGFIAFR